MQQRSPAGLELGTLQFYGVVSQILRPPVHPQDATFLVVVNQNLKVQFSKSILTGVQLNQQKLGNLMIFFKQLTEN